MKSFRRFVSLVFLSLLLSTLNVNNVFANGISFPNIFTNVTGLNDQSTAPPSTSIAANANEEMQLVNNKFKIFNSGTTINKGSISSLINTSGTFISDPQVMWDPLSNRFYFSVFENKGSSTPNEGIAWGFSKIANPKSTSDFCTYFNNFNYGSSSFPDRQSLGDTSDFLLIGSDRYSTTNLSFMGSDVAWLSKPPTGTNCPLQSSFKNGVSSLNNSDGSFPYSPVPAKQVDSSSTGWVTATPNWYDSNSLSIFKVTNTNGNAVVSPVQSLTVPEYSAPPSAPQAGKTMSGQPAPNLETRIYLTQVYMAFNPSYGHNVLWTAHTIAGGAGSMVRWYEIDPVKNIDVRFGNITDPTLYVYNATIAPDRQVNGSIKNYGSSAVVTVNTSSLNDYPAIQIDTKEDTYSHSGLFMVKQSSGPNIDFTCFEPNINYCRWGDYSGSAPFPGGPTNANYGKVWITNEWNVPNIDDNSVVWRTENALVKP